MQPRERNSNSDSSSDDEREGATMYPGSNAEIILGNPAPIKIYAIYPYC